MTAYGASFTATPTSNAVPQPLVLGSSYVALPCTTPSTKVAFTPPKTPELVLNGNAQTLDAAALFPILNVDPTTYTSALDAWGLLFRCGAGLSARFGNVRSAVSLTGMAIALTPGQLYTLFIVGAAQATDRYTLWQAAAPSSLVTAPELALPDSALIITLGAGSLVSFSSMPSAEVLLELGALEAILDRPLAADGSRIPLNGAAIVRRTRDASGITIAAASTLTPNLPSSIALVAENALIPVFFT